MASAETTIQDLSKYQMTAWQESHDSSVVGMCALLETAICAPSPTKRPRRSTSKMEVEPSTEEKRQFWNAVSAEDVDLVFEFCSSRPDLMSFWKKHEDDLRLGPLSTYAHLPTDGLPSSSLKSASLAILLLAGFDVPLNGLSMFCYHLYGRLLSHRSLTPHMPAISTKILLATKTNPLVLENVLVGIALAENYDAFYAMIPKSSAKKQLFYASPHVKVHHMTVLQAVCVWKDERIRKQLYTDMLQKSSSSYILARADGCDMEPRAARNVLEQLASLPDPALMSITLERLRTDGALERAQDALVGALKHSTTCTENTDAFFTTQMMLMQHVDEAHFSKLRHILYTLEQSAIQVKRRFKGDSLNPLYVNANVSLGMLARVQASFATVVKAADLRQRLSFISEEPTDMEEQLFQTRYASNLKMIDANVALQTEMSKLLDENRILEEQLKQQTLLLKEIQMQARTIASLRQRLETESSDSADTAKLKTQLESSEVLLFQSLETRLLALQMPDIFSGTSNSSSTTDLNLRLLKLQLPDVPSTKSQGVALDIAIPVLNS